MKPILPTSIAPPFGKYAHGIATDSSCRLIVTSGQLGVAQDGTIPTALDAQADICFGNIVAILAEAGAGLHHVIRLNAYVTRREDMAGYMAARDRWLADVPTVPASTLMIVTGFTKPEFLVEIEATAAVPVVN